MLKKTTLKFNPLKSVKLLSWALSCSEGIRLRLLAFPSVSALIPVVKEIVEII